MKRHLTIKKIDIKNTKNSDTIKTKIGEQEVNKKFNLSLSIELETSGNFEEFWNQSNPNEINLFILNKITELLGISGENPVYKIDL